MVIICVLEPTAYMQPYVCGHQPHWPQSEKVPGPTGSSCPPVPPVSSHSPEHEVGFLCGTGVAPVTHIDSSTPETLMSEWKTEPLMSLFCLCGERGPTAGGELRFDVKDLAAERQGGRSLM